MNWRIMHENKLHAPAYGSLSERIEAYRKEVQRLVKEGIEHQQYELKRECSLAKRDKESQVGLAKLVQGLANAHSSQERFIVIGAGQQEKQFFPVQNTRDFDTANVSQILEKYLSPVPKFEVFNSLTTDDGKPFVLIVLGRKQPRPIEAKRSGGAGAKSLREGDVWIKKETRLKLASWRDVQQMLADRIEVRHFISLDEYLDSSSPRHWPKRHDVEAGKVYQPDDYIRQVRERLMREKRCLLVGRSGAGKTALAMIFVLNYVWCGEQFERQGKSGKAVGFYLDAVPGATEQTGEIWHREIMVHDYQDALFVIDNCHLAPAAINAFCEQCERQPPEHSLVLLISAPRGLESPWEDEPEEYFDSFEQAEAVVEVEPEKIYEGVLRTYSKSFARTDPKRFTPVDLDLEDSERAARLERYCGHNLAAARSVLETWAERGGRLSDVPEKAALKGIASRHLTRLKTPALVPLCGLGQFEISAHGSFVTQLPEQSVAALEKENLILHENVTPYGRCDRINLHPQVANQIFRAHVLMQTGSVSEKRLEDEVVRSLKNYLSSSPENFIAVYIRLNQAKCRKLQHRLLRDNELQRCAALQFAARPLSEAVMYLYALYRIEPDRARSLLQEYTNRVGIETSREDVLNSTVKQFLVVSSFLPQIDLDIARALLGNLPVCSVADRISAIHMSSIATWIRPSSRSLAAKLGYPISWQRDVANALNLDSLQRRAQKDHPQALAWFLHALFKSARGQAELLVHRMSPEDLGKKISSQPLSVIGRIFGQLKKGGCDLAFRKRTAEALDKTQLFARVQDATLQQITWFLRELKAVAPEIADDLLIHITPARLAEMLRKKQATLLWLRHFSGLADKKFNQALLQELGHKEVIAIFERSKLGEIGSNLQWRYRLFKEYYEAFADKLLYQKLATEEITEVAKFIARIERTPLEGRNLAAQALKLLLNTDLATRVGKSDVKDVARLLYSAHKVDDSYPNNILIRLTHKGAVNNALKQSGIDGIQSLLGTLYDVAPTFLSSVKQSLEMLDLTDRIAEAKIKPLGRFLWNVRKSLGADVARSYCRQVDARLRPEQVDSSDLIDLQCFLWNLVQTSEGENLKTLSSSALQDRLREEWTNLSGPCIAIVGILATVRPNTTREVTLSPPDLQKTSRLIPRWLQQNLADAHPYSFALIVRGLRALNNGSATEILRKAFPTRFSLNKCVALLQEAMANVVTPPSRVLLEETIAFLRHT